MEAPNDWFMDVNKEHTILRNLYKRQKKADKNEIAR
jgi:hypothetical protein